MIVFPTHGLDCHICCNPTSWFAGGVSLPCRCGARDAQHLADAIKAVKAHQAPKPATPAPPAPTPEPTPEPTPRPPISDPMRELLDRRPPDEAEAWMEILAVLHALNGELARR